VQVDWLLALLRNLPPGTTELVSHPGLKVDLDTMYRVERDWEVKTLCDPAIQAAIRSLGIRLCSFSDEAVGGPPHQVT
jgi:hypothetical protein